MTFGIPLTAPLNSGSSSGSSGIPLTVPLNSGSSSVTFGIPLTAPLNSGGSSVLITLKGTTPIEITSLIINDSEIGDSLSSIKTDRCSANVSGEKNKKVVVRRNLNLLRFNNIIFSYNIMNSE